MIIVGVGIGSAIIPPMIAVGAAGSRTADHRHADDQEQHLPASRRPSFRRSPNIHSALLTLSLTVSAIPGLRPYSSRLCRRATSMGTEQNESVFLHDDQEGGVGHAARRSRQPRAED